MLAVQVVCVWVESDGSVSDDDKVKVAVYAVPPTGRGDRLAARPVIVDGESTTTANWSGLPDEAPAETTLKVSAVAAFAMTPPAAAVPRAASKVRAAPRIGGKSPVLPGSNQLGGISMHRRVRGLLAKCPARETVKILTLHSARFSVRC